MFQIEKQGLVISEDSLTKEAWERIGADLGATANASMWALGDWLVYGGRDAAANTRWNGSSYEHAERITGLSRDVLSIYYCVAKRFPRADRVPDCSWTHHRLAINLPPTISEKFLTHAAKTGQSASSFREQARAFSIENMILPKVARHPKRPSRRSRERVECPKCHHRFPVHNHKAI